MSRQWVKSVHALAIKPPEPILSWLTKPYILSEALKRRYEILTVHVLQQDFQFPLADEISALSLPSDETAFVREVILEAKAVPRTMGRVVIPMATYQANEQEFVRLENKPIGETLLYDKPGVTRDPFEYAYIEEKHCFARRSVFWLNNYPLLITDFFLPTLDDYV